MPVLRTGLVAPPLDLVLDTVTMLVTISVAALSWARFGQGHDLQALFQAAAFFVLAIGNGLTVALATTGLDHEAGMTLAAPGQAPLYDYTLAHLLAASLLVAGGVAALRGVRIRRPHAVVIGGAGALLVAIAVVHVAGDGLPALASGPTGSPIEPGPEVPVLSATVLGAAAQVIGAALCLWAAGVSRRLLRRDGAIGEAYLTIGLVLAAYSQVAMAFQAGTYTGLVSVGDLVRLAFDMTLLLGIQAEAGTALAGLQRANDDLARLYAVDLERAALEERARLSRELHDGLAQDLWLAKLATGRLAALPDLGLEANALTGELGDAIDAGLAEARQAVTALRQSSGAAGALGDLISGAIDDFADRFGIRVEFECQSGLPGLSPRAQAETLRIAQEALTNVRRHADATMVRVRVGAEGGRLMMVVGDNGCGFEPDATGRQGFGLGSMRERAALIGGDLRVDSRPRDGTRITLVVPFARVAATAGVP